MKKRFLAMLMAAVMVFALAACGSSASTSTTDNSASTSAAETSKAGKLTGTLKLGMIGPLTGGAAIYGQAVANAGQIAVDEINALSSDFKIEYNTQDDEHDPEKSVNAYNSLKDWKAQAILGTVTTSPCIAVGAEAFSDRMFMLTPSASSTDVTADKDNVYQLCFSDPNQGLASAQYIFDNKLATKVAIIYKNDDAYSTGIYKTFKDKADQLGLEIVSTTTFTDDSSNDFSTQIAAAQSAGADLLFLPIYYTPASLILLQCSQVGYNVTVFGVDGMDGILTMEGFDTSLAEGVILLTPFSADATDSLTQNFVKKYEATYKEIPNQFAADGYDVAYTFYYALKYYAEKNGGLDVTGKSYKEVCDIMLSVLTAPDFAVDGVTGNGMTWTTAGEVNKAPKAVVIKNGVYVGL